MCSVPFFRTTLLAMACTMQMSAFPQSPTRHIEFGLQGGLNWSVMRARAEAVNEENARMGYHIGAVVRAVLNTRSSIQMEALYSTMGSKVELEGPTDRTQLYALNYIAVPIVYVLRPTDPFELQLGFYTAYLLDTSTRLLRATGEHVEQFDGSDLMKVDAGLLAGGAVVFGRFRTGLRYGYGLAPLMRSSDAQALLGRGRNMFGQLYVSCFFGRKE